MFARSLGLFFLLCLLLLFLDIYVDDVFGFIVLCVFFGNYARMDGFLHQLGNSNVIC